MQFPEWAPQELILQYERTTTIEKKFARSNSGESVQDFADRQKLLGRELSESDLEAIRRSLARGSFSLPYDERVMLLKRVMTDLRMKDVWAALRRREKASDDPRRFWNACTGGILGWRREHKVTPKQKREHFQKINELVGELQCLLSASMEFHRYSVYDLISRELIEGLVESLRAPDFGDHKQMVDHTHLCLSEFMPSIYDIFMDLESKARKYEREMPIVLKPGSENAHVHYFVRSMSSFLNDYYGQPLHEVVASTAAVMLDRPEIDSDFVRKLVG